MWFGLLSPGAHPSRPGGPPGEVTVMAWTPEDRRKIDGPAWAVHGGLRTVRATFAAEGLVAAPPRCFVCLRACRLVDASEPLDLRGVAPLEALHRVDALRPQGGLGSQGGLGPGAAVPTEPGAALSFAELAPLAFPGEDRPLDEDVLVTPAGGAFALLTTLEQLPHTMLMLACVAPAPVCCTRCGVVLPGGQEQRALRERRELRGRSRGERRGFGRAA